MLKKTLILALSGLAMACSSPRKKTPELSRLEGKSIALIEIAGEATARSVTEVALINQIQKRGTFILVSKQDLEKARRSAESSADDAFDWARRAGADYALKVEAKKFKAENSEGYSSEEIEDSQLAEERGDDGKAERLYKVKSLDAEVEFEFTFTELKTGEVRTASIGRAERKVSEAKKGSAQLPPRLRFLEKLSNEAFAEFFDKYQ